MTGQIFRQTEENEGREKEPPEVPGHKLHVTHSVNKICGRNKTPVSGRE